MQEIKFRQPIFNTDGTFREFHYWGINISQGGEIVNAGWLTKTPKITDPAQSQMSIGLKDRYGVEIYVKDKVKFKFKHNADVYISGATEEGVVTWDNDNLCYKFGDWLYDKEDQFDIEVIGYQL